MVAPFGASVVETTDADATEAIWTGRVDSVVDHGTDWAADIVGDVVVIGVPDAGGIYTVDVATSGELGEEPTLEGGGRFGDQVRTVVRDKGSADLYVGAPDLDVARGALYVFRSAEGLLAGEPFDDPPEPDLTILGETPNDRIGENVVVCDDIDGDKVPDVILGVPTFQAVGGCGMDANPPPNLAGAAFVVRSSEVDLAIGKGIDSISVCDIADVVWGTELGERAGTAVACSLSGLFVGAPYNGVVTEETTKDRRDAGAVYRVPWTALPGRSPLTEVASQVFVGTVPDAAFGQALATLTLAGVPALLVGAPGFGGTDALGVEGERRGRVSLFVGDGLETGVVQATVRGEADGERFGRTVLGADLDGDNVEDVVLGSPDVADGERLDVGALWVWPNKALQSWSGVVSRDTASQTIRGTHAFQRVGRKLSRTTAQGRSVLLIPTRADPGTR